MATVSRGHIATLRGVGRMAIDATTGLTDLVQALHARIARAPVRLGGPLVGGAVDGITDFVYDSVRGVTRAVGGGLDAALAQLQPLMTAGAGPDVVTPAPQRSPEALLAALNGVLGDYLAQTHNPLAITMALRRDGQPLTLTSHGLLAAIEAPSPRIVVLAHGLCMNDLQWQRGVLARARDAAADVVTGVTDARATDPAGPPHDHGAALARDLGATAIYLHYNTGLHISTNGHEFAARLEALAQAWPVAIEQLMLVGHSMGGLVARSALRAGAQAGHAWPQHVNALVCLGTPHHGAPLARGGHWIDVLLESSSFTAPFARLGRVRSAGINDLRHGSVLDEDWRPRGGGRHHPLPLPAGIACSAIAATGSHAPNGAAAVQTLAELGEGADTLKGDGLVPVRSALGRHDDPAQALAFAAERQAVAWDCGHLDLLSSPAVYAQVRAWLEPPPAARET